MMIACGSSFVSFPLLFFPSLAVLLLISFWSSSWSSFSGVLLWIHFFLPLLT